MKPNEKKMIFILLLILIVFVIAFLNKNKDTKEENPSENTVKEEFVSVLEDGTKLNTSNKAKQTKEVNGLEFTDIQITEKDSLTILLATVTNKSENAIDTTLFDVVFLDKEGKEIVTVGGIVMPLQPGESTQFNTSMTLDYANVYDFQLKAK